MSLAFTLFRPFGNEGTLFLRLLQGYIHLVRLTAQIEQPELLLLLHQLCNLAGYLPERCLVADRVLTKVRAVFKLQDENGRLDLQERQQGDDNKDGRVEVSF